MKMLEMPAWLSLSGRKFDPFQLFLIANITLLLHMIKRNVHKCYEKDRIEIHWFSCQRDYLSSFPCLLEAPSSVSMHYITFLAEISTTISWLVGFTLLSLLILYTIFLQSELRIKRSMTCTRAFSRAKRWLAYLIVHVAPILKTADLPHRSRW